MVDTQVISSFRTSCLAVVIVMCTRRGRVRTVGQIGMKTQPTAAISRWGRRGSRGGRGGGKRAKGKVAVARFRVRGRLPPTSILQPSIRSSEGTARLLTRGAPLHLWALPLTHLQSGTHTHTQRSLGIRFSGRFSYNYRQKFMRTTPLSLDPQ